MVKLSVGTAVAVTISGCNGVIERASGGDSGTSPAGNETAINAWLASAQPALNDSNCFACHATGDNGTAPTFLGGSTDLNIRTTLLSYIPEVVNLDAPESSRLLSKGGHEGPAIASAQDLTNILDWIQLEATAANASLGATLVVGPSDTLLCTSGMVGDTTCPINTITLDSLAPGASITFVAQPLSDSTYLNNLTLVAGTQGVYVNHPLFVSVDSSGNLTPDGIDRFYDIQLDIQSGSALIGGGAAGFDGFLPTNKLEIAFQAISAYNPADSMGGGSAVGCKALPQFASDAIPMLGQAIAQESNYCENCHGGQSSMATADMNLTNINDGQQADQQTVCNDLLALITFVNGSAGSNSPLLLAPEPGQDSAHPFKLSADDFTTFANGIQAWATSENQ